VESGHRGGAGAQNSLDGRPLHKPQGLYDDIDARRFGVGLAIARGEPDPAAELVGGREAVDPTELGDEHRVDFGGNAIDGLDGAVAEFVAEPAGDLCIDAFVLVVVRVDWATQRIQARAVIHGDRWGSTGHTGQREHAAERMAQNLPVGVPFLRYPYSKIVELLTGGATLVDRLPLLSPTELDNEQMGLYKRIIEGPRAVGGQRLPLLDSEGHLTGPFNAMLHSPALGDSLQALGLSIRFKIHFSERIREIAILTVAAFYGSDFEWISHETLARRIGLSDSDLSAIRRGQENHFCDLTERCVIRTIHRLLRNRDLNDEDYQTAARILGNTGLVELTTLVGYYALLALQLQLFRVAPPDESSYAEG
jgi:4-carboxymuconolactone decarboxylase